MKNLKYIVFLMAVVTFTSCNRDELLDIEPFGISIPSTVDQFRLMMDEGDGFLVSDGRMPHYDIDFFMVDDIKINDDNWGNYLDKPRYADAIRWLEDFGTVTEDDHEWKYLNNHILIMNIVLEAMDDPTVTGDEALRSLLRAEAKVHRAFAYWCMVNLYSKQYDPATAATDLGVPIRPTSQFQESYTRASVQEVYDIILADLNDAINSGVLPAGRQDISHRANMAGAYAVLAKTYLAMGNYQEALNAANNCLQNYDVLLDYKTIFALPSNRLNPEIFMLKTRLYDSDVPFGPHAPSDELIDLYSAGDTRTSMYFSQNFFTGALEYDRSPSTYDNNNYIAPTVSEMYLIRAECNARMGDLTAVDDDLNALGQNRITGYTPLADFTDRASALTYVKDERRREFPGKGLRLFDIKRYNAFDNDNISISRTIDGTTYTIEGNSNRWIVPLTPKVLSLDPGLEQSPR